MEPSFALGRHTRAHILQLVRIQNGQTNIFKHRHWVCISQDLTPDTRAHILQMVIVQNIRLWQKNGTYLGLNDFHSQNRIDCIPHPHTFWMKCIDSDKTPSVFYGLLWQDKKILVRYNIGEVNIAGLSQSYCWKEPKRKMIKKKFLAMFDNCSHDWCKQKFLRIIIGPCKRKLWQFFFTFLLCLNL